MRGIGFTVGVLALLAGPAAAQELTDFIEGPKKSYLLDAPRLVADSFVRSLEWTEDGKLLIVGRTPGTLAGLLSLTEKGMDPRSLPMEIGTYDPANRRYTGWITLKPEEGRVVSFTPFAQGGAAVVIAAQAGDAIVARVATLAAPGRTPTVLAELKGGDVPLLIPSPRRNHVIALSAGMQPGSGAKITLVRSNALGWSVGIPSQAFPIWDNQTERLFLTVFRNRSLFRVPIDLATGALGREIPEPDPVPEAPGLQALETNTSVTGMNAPLRASLLAQQVSTDEGVRLVPNALRGLVGTGLESVSVSPDGKWVAFIQSGTALLRPIVPVDAKRTKELLEARVRESAVKNSKQVALGLVMMAADHDDELPGNVPDWQDRVKPYLKNPSPLNGFVYTFPGGNLSKLEKPGETELGYTLGPGGKAVAYADGSVRWVPDKPTG